MDQKLSFHWLACALILSSALTGCAIQKSAPEKPSYSAPTMIGPELMASLSDSSDPIPILAHVDTRAGRGTTDSVSNSKNLIDHGGPVLASPNIYLVYWGNPSDFPPGLDDALSKFYEGFGGSSYANITTQYFRGAPPPVATLVGAASDTSAPPASAPKVKNIVSEACKFTDGSVDPNGIYVVAASKVPKKANFCAWHNKGLCNGSPIAVVYLPNVGKACQITPTSQNNYSKNTQSIVNYAAHELVESMSDPQINAWLDVNGREAADKCDKKFGAPVTFSNGSIWTLQELWSNANGRCLQSLPLR